MIVLEMKDIGGEKDRQRHSKAIWYLIPQLSRITFCVDTKEFKTSE